MIIIMILGKVCETRCREGDLIHPVLIKAVARRLHGGVRYALVS